MPVAEAPVMRRSTDIRTPAVATGDCRQSLQNIGELKSRSFPNLRRQLSLPQLKKQFSVGAKSSKVNPAYIFDLLPSELWVFHEKSSVEENLAALEDLGGVDVIADLLHVDPDRGITGTKEELYYRRQIFGSNNLNPSLSPVVEPEPRGGGLDRDTTRAGWVIRRVFDRPVAQLQLLMSRRMWQLFIETFRNQTMQILIGATVASLFMGVLTTTNVQVEDGWWIESLAILTAVLIIAVITAMNDLTQEVQFQQLVLKNNDVPVKVKRNGEYAEISIYEVQVGDVVTLEAGDKIPADGLYLRSFGAGAGVGMHAQDPIGAQSIDDPQQQVVVNEARDLKSTCVDKIKNATSDPFFFSGYFVTSGYCDILIVAVGANSRCGRRRMKSKSRSRKSLVSEEFNHTTPVMKKLQDLGTTIGYVGTGVALLTIFLLLLWAGFRYNDGEDDANNENRHAYARHKVMSNLPWESYLIQSLILCITLVVVAIPEGSSIAITMSFSYSIMKMLKDNTLMRNLETCERMGQVTSICSNITGTLTENRLSVEQVWFQGQVYQHAPPAVSNLTPDSTRNDRRDTDSVSSLDNTTGGKSTTTQSQTSFPLFALANLEATHQQMLQDTVVGIAMNSLKANLRKQKKRPSGVEVQGNQLEGALLLWMKDLAFDYSKIRCAQQAITSSTGPAPAKEQQIVADQWYYPPLNVRKNDDLSSSTSGKGGDVVTTIRRYASTGHWRVYCQGRAELLISENGLADDPSALISASLKSASRGGPHQLSVHEREMHQILRQMSKRALRPYAVAHRDFEPHELIVDAHTGTISHSNNPDLCYTSDLTLDAIFGLRDPIRLDIHKSVQSCEQAGITVRIITAENEDFAKAVARECGILRKDSLVRKGPDFRSLSRSDAKAELSQVHVLCQSTARDKTQFVKQLRKQNFERSLVGCALISPSLSSSRQGKEVVAVTGASVQDAAALMGADVGLSMGQSGTDVSKKASDIIIMDDRFDSIMRAVLWGRAIFDSIQKFLQFQLTVNIVTLSLTLVSVLVGSNPPLNAVKMLWVNLIMDTMGALALATEPPRMSLMLQQPQELTDHLVSCCMWRNILGQACYQLIVLFVLIFAGGEILGVAVGNPCLDLRSTVRSEFPPSMKDFYVEGQVYRSCDEVLQSAVAITAYPDACVNRRCLEYDYTHTTVVFNVFVFCQIFNEFNSRHVGNTGRRRVLGGLTQSPMFLFVIAFTVVVQVLVVEFGGDFTQTSSLELKHWILSLVLGGASLPVGMIIRMCEPPSTTKVDQNTNRITSSTLATLPSISTLSPVIPTKS